MVISYPDFEHWQKMAKQVLGNEFMKDFFAGTAVEGPRYNLYRNSSEIIVLVELPYVKDISDIKLIIREKELVIKGKIEIDFDHLEAVQKQIFSGEFEKKIPIPEVINTKKVNAQYQKGILKVQLFPKLRYGGKPIPIQEI